MNPMKTLAASLALALAVASVPLSIAHAAPPERVEGLHCATLAAVIGKDNVWSTWFRGYKTGLFDNVDSFVSSPCFRKEADCKAWLYWAQTDWPERNNFRPCAKGIG